MRQKFFPISVLLLIISLRGGQSYLTAETSINSTDTESVLRIIGGAVTRPNEFPWIVRIHKKNSKELLCGGSLIGTDVVLTAARCVQGQDLALLEIVAGDHIFNDVTGTEQTRNIRRGIIHQGFTVNKLEHDIALLFLQSNVSITIAVQVARLPAISDVPTETAVVAGWGHTSESALPLALMKVSVRTVPATDCARSYEGLFTNNVICYGAVNLGFCTGDTGSPLICGGADISSQTVCGIVSYSNGCAIANFPGVYTKVSNYLDWIERTRKSSSGTTITASSATSSFIFVLLVSFILM